jgi:hypothetical protein
MRTSESTQSYFCDTVRLTHDTILPDQITCTRNGNADYRTYSSSIFGAYCVDGRIAYDASPSAPIADMDCIMR